MKALVSTFALALALALTGPAFASQNIENKELWRDLQTGETPPEAAVGNEGQAQAPREWERAKNMIDCEKAGGMWDVPNNKCSEKR
jgi:hypothetical protein